MKNITGIFATIVISLILSLGALSEAQAKRFGGGGNFGSRPSYSAPYQRSAPSQQSQNTRQQQASPQGQPARQGWASRGGLMGMLGGLAIGGLLGSMFSGGGFHGGINFFDILIFGGIAFLLFKMLAARKASAQRPAYSKTYDDKFQDASSNYSQYSNPNPPDQASSGFNTDILFDKNKKPGDSSSPNFQKDADFSTAIIPADFDSDAFLNGAKIAYRNLQKAWDARDLAEIRGLTTDKVFAEIQDQLRASTEENHTDILKINAEILEVREIGNEIEAVVLFDNIMREDQASQSTQIREVWHFVKPNNRTQTKWLLDGIQQLED